MGGECMVEVQHHQGDFPHPFHIEAICETDMQYRSLATADTYSAHAPLLTMKYPNIHSYVNPAVYGNIANSSDL